MKKILLFFLVLSTFGLAQNINGRISSSIYSFEKVDVSGESDIYIRGYQSLNLNFNYDNYSLRTSLNFENDFKNKMANDSRLRFYNLYFEARKLFDIATLKLGRQSIFNSVVGGVFDGISLSLKYKDYNLNTYFGGNVPAYQELKLTDKIGEDNILGADFSTSVIENFLFGVGFVSKNFKAVEYSALRLDEQFNPILVLIKQQSNQYKFFNGKINYNLKDVVDVYSKYEYDLNFKELSKVELECDYIQVKDWSFNLYFNYREPKVRYNSFFAIFDYQNTKEVEAGIKHDLTNWLSLNARFGYIKFTDINSERLTVAVYTPFGNLNYRKTFGDAGELDAISLSSGYSFFDGFLSPSLGVGYTNYKVSKNDKSNSLASVLAGINVRPMRYLSCDLQGQYLNNKYYKNDYRFLFKINYWFNTNL